MNTTHLICSNDHHRRISGWRRLFSTFERRKIRVNSEDSVLPAFSKIVSFHSKTVDKNSVGVSLKCSLSSHISLSQHTVVVRGRRQDGRFIHSVELQQREGVDMVGEISSMHPLGFVQMVGSEQGGQPAYYLQDDRYAFVVKYRSGLPYIEYEDEKGKGFNLASEYAGEYIGGDTIDRMYELYVRRSIKISDTYRSLLDKCYKSLFLCLRSTVRHQPAGGMDSRHFEDVQVCIRAVDGQVRKALKGIIDMSGFSEYIDRVVSYTVDDIYTMDDSFLDTELAKLDCSYPIDISILDSVDTHHTIGECDEPRWMRWRWSHSFCYSMRNSMISEVVTRFLPESLLVTIPIGKGTHTIEKNILARVRGDNIVVLYSSNKNEIVDIKTGGRREVETFNNKKRQLNIIIHEDSTVYIQKRMIRCSGYYTVISKIDVKSSSFDRLISNNVYQTRRMDNCGLRYDINSRYIVWVSKIKQEDFSIMINHIDGIITDVKSKKLLEIIQDAGKLNHKIHKMKALDPDSQQQPSYRLDGTYKIADFSVKLHASSVFILFDRSLIIRVDSSLSVGGAYYTQQRVDSIHVISTRYILLSTHRCMILCRMTHTSSLRSMSTFYVPSSSHLYQWYDTLGMPRLSIYVLTSDRYDRWYLTSIIGRI